MSVKVHLHLTLRRFADGQEVVDVEGRTVGECLKELVKKFPDMGSSLFDKKGGLINIVEVYVNLESAYPDELAKPVKDGDKIHLTLMLAGG
ncbi:MAG: MoaD/ThiS family protein [Proteobacteria bacterium]|nr:MoaD/ThiS family protein [Pseudomonadota bacterium]